MQFYNDLLGHDPSPLYNSHGHRCKELSELNIQNYILFAGDNVSLGLDKPVEETYPYLTAKALNIDYYNLSLFNGGIDSIKYNLLTWFATMKRAPKAVVVSTEFLNSFLVSDVNYKEIKVADFNTEMVKSFLDSGNTTGFLSVRHLLAERILQNSIHVPIYQIKFKSKFSLFSENKFDIDYDNEVIYHSQITDLLIAQYKRNQARVLP
jgi:hypothetical protein